MAQEQEDCKNPIPDSPPKSYNWACCSSNFITPYIQGQILYTPTPENTLLSVGGVQKGGAYKIPAAWALKIYIPTPLSRKMPLARNGGGGWGRI